MPALEAGYDPKDWTYWKPDGQIVEFGKSLLISCQERSLFLLTRYTSDLEGIQGIVGVAVEENDVLAWQLRTFSGVFPETVNSLEYKHMPVGEVLKIRQPHPPARYLGPIPGTQIPPEHEFPSNKPRNMPTAQRWAS